MTVIAWDGETLAADKRIAGDDYEAQTCVKLLKLDEDTVVAYTGTFKYFIAILNWYRAGAEVASFPDVTDMGYLIVVSRSSGMLHVVVYEASPYPYEVFDKFAAWGSGSLGAKVAMEMGADAAEAVRVTSLHNLSCGNGVDSYTFKPLPMVTK